LAALAVHGYEPSDVLSHYDAALEVYGVYIVPDDVMGILSRVTRMELRAFNLFGLIGVSASDAEKMREGDPEALLVARHEKRHNDYRALHGDPPYEVEQKLVDELYAYFSSYVDIYGIEGLSHSRHSDHYGNGTYTQIVAASLYEGDLGNVADPQKKLELGVKISAAAFILEAYLKAGQVDLALGYLKAAKNLNQILAMTTLGSLNSAIERNKAHCK